MCLYKFIKNLIKEKCLEKVYYIVYNKRKDILINKGGIMKRIGFWLSSFVVLIVSMFVLTACSCNEDNAVITGISIELINEDYVLEDNTINVVYGNKVDLKYSDFKVIASLDNGKTKELSKKSGSADGYTYQSSIPQSYDKTPVNNYTIVISYGDFDPIVIMVKVAKADFSGSLHWNYDSGFIYSGEEQSVEIIDLPEGVVVDYAGISSATNTGTYSCTASFICINSNYKSIPDMSLTWVINPAPIDIGEIVFLTKAYNETEQTAEMSEVSLPNNVEITEITGTTTATNVGVYEVTVNFAVIGEGAENYYVEPITTTWEITKGTYSRVGSVDFDRTRTQFVRDNVFVYDGIIHTVYLDFSNLDSNVRSAGVSFDSMNKVDAGQYEIVVELEYIGDNPNYQSEAGSVTLYWEIEKAPLVITVADHTITYGDVFSCNNLDASNGFASADGSGYSEDYSFLEGEPTFLCEYEQYDNVGTYNIEATGYTSNNYDISYVLGTLTVSKKSLVITPKSVSVKYSEDIVYDGVIADGFVGDDTLAVLGGTPIFTSEYTNTTTVGTYTTSVSGYTSGNYDISYRIGTLYVVENTIDVSSVALVKKELVFNREVQGVAIKTSSLPTGVSVVNIVMDKDGKTTQNVGNYTAEVTLAYVDTVNYKPIPKVYLDWKIIKADVDISGYSYVSNQLTYNGTEQSVAFTELPAGAEIKNISGNTGKDVNLYHCIVTIGCSDTHNYNDFTDMKAFNWRIAPLRLTVRANNNTITYGDSPTHNGIAEITGFATGEDASILSGEIVYKYNYNLGGDIGSYVINIQDSTLSSNNYNITFVNGTLTVIAKEVDLDGYVEEWQTEDTREYNPSTPFTPVIVNLPTGVRAYYTYTLNDGSNTEVPNPIAVDAYMATAQLVKENNNYTLINNNGVGAFSFEIVKGELDASALVWSVADGVEVEYSGTSLKPRYTTTLTGLDIIYTYYCQKSNGEFEELDDNVDIIAVGNYKVVAEFDYDANSYNYTPANITEIEYSIVKIVVDSADIEFEVEAEKTNQTDNNITYSVVVEYTGNNIAIALKEKDYLKIEYSIGGEYSSVVPSVLGKGEYEIYARVSISVDYADRYELDGGYAEYLIAMNVVVEQIIFDTLKVNGRDAILEEISVGINKVAKYGTIQFTIRDRYALVMDDTNAGGDEFWTLIDGYYEFLDFDKTYNFYVVDKNINSELNKYASESGILYEIKFEVNFVNQVIYGINSEVYNNPNGQNVYYELEENETSFSITLDEESLDRLSGSKFSYMIIDSVDGWLDPQEVSSFPLVFDDLTTIKVIMLYIEVGANNNRSIIQFTIFQPTHISSYETTTIDISTGERGVSTNAMGSMGQTIVNALVVDLKVNLKEEYSTAGYTVGYFADEEHTKSAEFTELGLLYLVYFVVYDPDGQPVEEGEFYYSHAFISSNVTALALNCKNPEDEKEYFDWVCVEEKAFALEFDLAEGITISQTYNGEETLELVEGPQIIDYVLTIHYMDIDYTFAIQFEVICTPNIISCFTQEVQSSYVYKLSNTEETISYYIGQNNSLNYIDISNEYNTSNVNDFEAVLQELIFPMDSGYLITDKSLVGFRDKYFVKLVVNYGGTSSSYYIELKVANA